MTLRNHGPLLAETAEIGVSPVDSATGRDVPHTRLRAIVALLPVLLRTRRRRAVSDNISAFATHSGIADRRKAVAQFGGPGMRRIQGFGTTWSLRASFAQGCAGGILVTHHSTLLQVARE